MNLKLHGKITILVLAAVLIVFTVIFGVTSAMNRRESMEQARLLAMSRSAEFANEIALTLETAMNSARAVAHALEGVSGHGTPDRSLVNAILAGVLRRNPGFIGIWTCWEPNAFDGKDREFANTDGHDATGRFIPYWFRDGQNIASEPLAGYNAAGDGDYYLIPLKSGRESILEPFEYEVAGKKTLMTSLAVPIHVNGKIAGVAGVDIALNEINEITRQVRLYDTGFGRLMSHSGIVAGHPDDGRVGEIAGEIREEGGDRVLRRIQSGDSWFEEAWSVSLNRNTLKAFAPVRVGDAPTPWSFGTVILEEEVMASSTGLLFITVLLAAAGLVLISAAVWIIAGWIVKPVKRVAELAERAKMGDLTISREEFDIRSRDELGIMADSLANMISAQAETVLEIQKVAMVISSTSENLAALSQETNASMEEVRSHLSEAANLSESNAASIEEGTAGIEEVAGGAQAMAKAAVEGAASGKKAENTATDSVEKVNAVIRDLRTVGEKARASVESISQLDSAVKDISGFVNVISSIADQTNLLALNAAIEAARAGDAGRGFAVVADEVRKLAEESARAASEVSKLIRTLEKTTDDSISVTTEAGQIMGNTVSRAQEAGSGLQTALEEIRRVVDTITGIATTSEEQAASSEEMASAMDQLSKGTLQITELVRNISKASEETSTAAEGVAVQAQEMSLRGEELLSRIARFKLQAQKGGGLVPAPDKGRR